MLRLYQRVSGKGLWAYSAALREYANWPADVPVPAGLKPFDPNGSLGQVDTYMQGLPEDDELVQSVRKYKNLRVAVEKLGAEHKAAGPDKPTGLVSLPDGSIDADYYTTNQGIHADFVTGLKSIMAEEAAKQPTPKPFTAWADTWKAIEPKVVECEQAVLKELDELRKEESVLADTEERLDDLTIDQVLDLYPQLAQEIKDEIEGGEYGLTNAGHKM